MIGRVDGIGGVNLRSLTAAVFSLALAVPAIGQEPPEDLDIQYAEKQPLADQSLLLDVRALPGGGFVAVGERGHILLSDDGDEWRQADVVPTRSTLTSVAVAGGRIWAAGHDTVIMTSGDGGLNWTLQYFDPLREQPILDLHFFDERRGIAVGAYGLVLVTDDGGSTWEDHAASDEEWHYNSIVDLGGGRLMLAGEAGFSYRSLDAGDTWETIEMPYGGSMFGIVRHGSRCVLTFGLRGNVQRSCDFGDSWDELDTRTQASMIGGISDGDEALLVGKSGTVVRVRGDDILSVDTIDTAGDLAAIARMADGGYVLVGENGVQRYDGRAAQGGAE